MAPDAVTAATATPQALQLRQVPARRGVLWVRQGFAIFARQPLAFAGLFATFLFSVFLLMLVPLAGPFLLLSLLPLASLGFMIATRSVLDGGWPRPSAFFEPLRRTRGERIAMLKLGLIYAAATFVIMWLSDVLDGGALDALMEAMSERGTTPDAIAARVGDPALLLGLMLRMTMAALLSVPFWHAPALVHWGGQGVAQSLFSSTLACWRNRAAYAAFGLAWTAVILVFGLVANLIFALIGQTQMIALVAMPASLLFSTVFYASLYFTYADCFGSGDDTPA